MQLIVGLAACTVAGQGLVMIDPVEMICEYGRFPSVSTDSAYAEGMVAARRWMAAQLESIGFLVETVETPLHPILLASRGPESTDVPHVLIYSHYDVQPADPYALWDSAPFEPSVRGGRVYGRGAADNKGPTMIQFCALKRLLDRDPNLPLRITWLIEGEEEMGSPSFPGFIRDYADRLGRADFIVMSDSGSQSRDQIVITTALRGLIGLEVELTGPKMDLHSGIHGGAIHNPIAALAELCASLHAADGSVNVPGFYDGVVEPEAWEREELKRLGRAEAEYRDFVGVPAFRTPPGMNAFEAVRFAPTLEFNGISGGYQGEGTKTIIPSNASAKLTCRLVADQHPDAVFDKVARTLRERCPAGVRVDVKRGDGGIPYLVVPPGRSNTPTGQPVRLAKAFSSAAVAVEQAFGAAPYFLREGGSVPIIGQIKEATGLDAVMIGLFLPEDNLHAPNESMAVEMIEKGVACYERFFEEIARSA